MPDSAVSLLFNEIIIDAPAGIFIGRKRILIYVVQKIEIEVVHLTFFELLLKGLLGIVFLRYSVTRKFIGKIEALSGIILQYLSDNDFGHSVMIGNCCVIVVNSVLHGIVHHFRGEFLIY